MLGTRAGPFGAHEQQFSTLHGQPARQFAETDIVADDGRAGHTVELEQRDLPAGRKECVLIHKAEEVHLVVEGEVTPLAVDDLGAIGDAAVMPGQNGAPGKGKAVLLRQYAQEVRIALFVCQRGGLLQGVAG